MMNWNIKTQNNKLYVTLSVTPLVLTPQGAKQVYATDSVIAYLKNNNISFGKVLHEAIVYNYQTQKRCTGTWIFSLPEKQKARKNPKPLENKESVTKISNKKSIKK